MSSLEKKNRELQEQNNELVKTVQYWKMEAGEKDKTILNLTKEVNDLRIQISIIRTKSSASERKLEENLQFASQTALSHILQGSNAVAEMIEHIKRYMLERDNITEISACKKSAVRTPNSEKVMRVPPLLYAGISIQPVVSLRRAMLPHNILTESQEPNVNHNPVRAVPMSPLQELYIPLTRIDADTVSPNDMEINQNTSIEDMGLEESNDDVLEEDHEPTRDSVVANLSVITEESEGDVASTVADPVEGPSHLLESTAVNGTDDESMQDRTPLISRKRISSPGVQLSPIFLTRNKTKERTLKVVLSKMRLDDDNSSTREVPSKKVTLERARCSSERTKRLRRTSSSSRNAPGPSQDKFCDKPGPSGDGHVSPLARPDACNLSWEKPSLEQSRSPGNKPGTSKDNSTQPWVQPGPSRNKHISPSYKLNGDSSRDNEHVMELPNPAEGSSQNVLERCPRDYRRDSYSNILTQRTHYRCKSPEYSPSYSISSGSPYSACNLRFSVDSPVKLTGEIATRQSRDSSGKRAQFDVSSLSLDSQSNDVERPLKFDAPSPNGATNSRVIVQEAKLLAIKTENSCDSRLSRHCESSDASSDFSDELPLKRERRSRKPVVYKEKSLNRKLRRT